MRNLLKTYKRNIDITTLETFHAKSRTVGSERHSSGEVGIDLLDRMFSRCCLLICFRAALSKLSCAVSYDSCTSLALYFSHIVLVMYCSMRLLYLVLTSPPLVVLLVFWYSFVCLPIFSRSYVTELSQPSDSV